MDSLTQIILGAAVGEATLGRKVGNRAMLWGAVGGTIPDLDVLGGLFLSEIDNVAFHRGFSHSILFCILGAFLFGWLVNQIYTSSNHKWIAITTKSLAGILIISALQFVFSRLYPDNFIPLIVAFFGVVLLGYFNIKKSYFSSEWTPPNASIRDWQWLFFWALITHPLLDCFTMYGTQLFLPFSNMRVAWSTISVADPLYTLPFLVCLIIASRISFQSPRRRHWNYIGIIFSSAYLLFTVFNKNRINQLFADSIKNQGTQIERFITNPSILTNILWNYTGEAKNHYYLAQYSLFDKKEVTFSKIDKNHDLLKNYEKDKTLQTLQWFSDGFFTLHDMGDEYQFSDLRFGSFSGKGTGPDDYFFRFMINEEDGLYQLNEVQSGPPEDKRENMFSLLFKRVMGIDSIDDSQASQPLDTVQQATKTRELVWSDEFDKNGPVDTLKWFHQTKLPSGGNWYNNEVQHYTNRIDNSFVENGILKIVAKKETFTDQGQTKQYTSARLNSKFSFKCGRVDIRAKLPSGRGTWPAFWTLGKNISEDGAYWQKKGFGNTSWPACGEIDIMEHWGREQDLVKSATHTPFSHGETINQGGRVISTCSSEFHIYSLDWSEEKLVFMIDDVVHYTYNPTVKNKDTWPYTSEQYLLLNFAIEPLIDPNFISDAIEIDYVRVYN